MMMLWLKSSESENDLWERAVYGLIHETGQVDEERQKFKRRLDWCEYSVGSIIIIQLSDSGSQLMNKVRLSLS
jgi:hypothetical protein